MFQRLGKKNKEEEELRELENDLFRALKVLEGIKEEDGKYIIDYDLLLDDYAKVTEEGRENGLSKSVLKAKAQYGFNDTDDKITKEQIEGYIKQLENGFLAKYKLWNDEVAAIQNKMPEGMYQQSLDKYAAAKKEKETIGGKRWPGRSTKRRRRKSRRKSRKRKRKRTKKKRRKRRKRTKKKRRRRR